MAGARRPGTPEGAPEGRPQRETGSPGARRILDDLRAARILVAHPHDEEGEELVKQLRRIGCDVRAAWPIPRELPADIDTVFLLADQVGTEDPQWRLDTDEPTLVAILDYESPTSLKALVDWNPQGVITKPMRSAGVLSTLVLARYLRGYQGRLAAKARKLEETLKARREIERATKILMALKQVSDHEAYQLLRDQATARRITLAEVAASIIAASETMGSLGIDIRSR